MNLFKGILKNEIRSMRLITRLLSLLPIIFYSSILLFNEDVWQKRSPSFFIWGLVIIFLLAAWRWEKKGGILAMVGALALVIVFTLGGIRYDFTIVQALMVSGVVALPHLLLGWLFYSLGQRADFGGSAQ